MDDPHKNKTEEDVHTEYFVSADVPMDDSDTDDECIDEFIKRNNSAIQRAIDSIAAARFTLVLVCSPWQQEADTMIEKDESDMPKLRDL
mmetsp:Transcript_32280/g.35908  ORF Transcript_32280/g.35908 Transcript_32280/m.35908 type:complete len:89 (+) Transcript_32280:51-317(+)